jgi:hypothetical protein
MVRWSGWPSWPTSSQHSSLHILLGQKLTIDHGCFQSQSQWPRYQRPRSKGPNLLQQVRNRTDGPDGQVGLHPPNMLHYSLLISLGQKFTIDHGCLQSQSQWPRCQTAQKQGLPSALIGPVPHGWSGWPSWSKSSSKVSAHKL